MKKMVFPIMVLPVMMLVVCGASGDKDKPAKEVSQVDVIEWVKFDVGLKQAAEDNKYIMVYFWGPGCGWCKRIEQDTYSNEKIADLVGAYFTPIKVNGSSDEKYKTTAGEITAKQLARKFRLRGYPSVCFLKSDGSILTCLPGYIPPQKFETVLKYIGEEHYKNKSYQDYLKSIEKKY